MKAVRANPLWITAGSKLADGAFPVYGVAQTISMPFLGIDGAGIVIG